MAFTNQQIHFFQNILTNGLQVAMQFEQTIITTDHIAYAILGIGEIQQHLIRGGIDHTAMCAELKDFLEEQMVMKPMGQLGGKTQKVTDICMAAASKSDREKRDVDVIDVLLEIFHDEKSNAAYLMHKYGITEGSLLEIQKSETPNPLEDFCINLNEKVKTSSDPLIGREKELFAISHSMSRKSKNSVCLIGEPGVGKSAVVEGLAQRINSGNVPENLKGKIIYSLNVGEILAGCNLRGDFEEKIKNILHALVQNKKAILFIDEAHQMDAGAGSGTSQGMSFSNMFKPELSRGRIKVIAATTWEGYRTTFEKDSALMRRFRIVTVDEPSPEDTLLILNGLKKGLEDFHHTIIKNEAINAAVELSVKYIHGRFLPDKAIDIIDSVCARNKISTKEAAITKEMVVKEVSDQSGIPINFEENSKENTNHILGISDEIKQVVFNQNEAVDSVCEGILISSAGLSDGKPASYLLAGPSGVGKTYLAKTVAAKTGMHFLRYDMSEYSEKHTSSKLIGCPPGYVGHDSEVGEGMLVHDLIKHPNSVILFDEIEKAHSSISTVFLQLLDEGRITGSTGKTANARNCIIMFTSNLGSSDANKGPLGFNKSSSQPSAISKAVDSFFLTELRGRLTKIIEFNPLDDLSYRKIVVNRVNELGKLLSNRNIIIVPSENLIDHIISLNDAKQFGARKINNLVDSIIKLPLSISLLKGEITNNNTISLDWKLQKLNISAKKLRKTKVTSAITV
jgi:ATP-dependent Clp protease ATP-binding subunit ClpA